MSVNVLTNTEIQGCVLACVCPLTGVKKTFTGHGGPTPGISTNHCRLQQITTKQQIKTKPLKERKDRNSWTVKETERRERTDEQKDQERNRNGEKHF